MLTEERTAKFNNSIRVNWKTERERERERVRTPGLHITPPGKLREQRGICSTRLQGAFTLMSACHHIQDRGSRYMLRASVRAMTHTCTHTHPIAYIHRLSTLPSLSISPSSMKIHSWSQPLKVDSISTLRLTSSSQSQLIFTSLMSLQRAPLFLLIDLTKLSIPPEDRHLILFSI